MKAQAIVPLLVAICCSCAQSTPPPSPYPPIGLTLEPQRQHSPVRHRVIDVPEPVISAPPTSTDPRRQKAIDQVTKAQLELRTLRNKIEIKEKAKTIKEGDFQNGSDDDN